MKNTESILELRDVQKHYFTGAPEPVKVLTGVNLVLRRGESLAIVGPSGSGKSTLLNIAGALDSPSAGTVLFDGESLAGMTERERATLRAGKLGFIFQLHHLLPQCTVWENVLVPTLAVCLISAVEGLVLKVVLDCVDDGVRHQSRTGIVEVGHLLDTGGIGS